jgi:hypothetical protein
LTPQTAFLVLWLTKERGMHPGGYHAPDLVRQGDTNTITSQWPLRHDGPTRDLNDGGCPRRQRAGWLAALCHRLALSSTMFPCQEGGARGREFYRCCVGASSAVAVRHVARWRDGAVWHGVGASSVARCGREFLRRWLKHGVGACPRGGVGPLCWLEFRCF